MPPPALPFQGHNDVALPADYPPPEAVSPISHPPRDDLLIPAPHVSRHGHTPPSTHPSADDVQPNRTPHHSHEASRSTPASTPTFKIGGFKPIGQASPAVRRFFPGDEDEREDVEKRHTSPQLIPASHYRPPVPAPLVQNGQPPFSSGEPYHRSHYDLAPRSPYPIAGRPLGNSPVHPAPYPGHDEKLRERPLIHDYPIYYDHEQTRHHDQREPAYYHDEQHQHFSSHNGHEYPPPPHDQDDVRERDRDFSHAREPELTRPNTPDKSSRDELYSIVSQVGEGTFGKVYKARNTVTGLYVALKRIRMETERDGFPVTAMREIKLLQSLRHDNIVRLYEMMVSNGSVYMVFEYMDHDLTGILSQDQFTFTDAHLKSLCQQMLAGLAYLHHKGIIHRDIKGSNILVNNRGELKLGDFGLARFYHKRRRSDYTNRVITLWYRPPELLFGTTVYGPEVDMWSAGCIMLELFTTKPIFQGNDEIHQLEFIFKILGTPTPERWPGVTNLPWYELVKPKEAIPNRFRDLFRKWLSPAGLDLAEELLAFDPLHRVTAVQALEAAYFKAEAPPPAMPTGLSSLEGEWHELETKRERAKKRRRVEGGAAQ
ncbi:kinase-like domain-containing protein [Russula dissimulans]|nr:kinase-like domain-containing protein [Russula dissimulans]